MPADTIAPVVPASFAARARFLAFWFFTLVIVWEMTAGSLWDLLQIDFVRGVFDDLHYPPYLLLILGAWKLPCAFVLLLPRLLRLKEWAYAGAFFTYSGATASHLFAGEGPAKWAGPAIFAAMVLGSWALRPPARTLGAAATTPTIPTTAKAWLIPTGVVLAFAVLALLTLPRGSGA